MKEGETMKQLLTVMMVLALFLPMISCAEPVDAMAAAGGRHQGVHRGAERGG